jgi:two-component system cell cycle sensor histidine kinase/response regulator CckA
MNGSVAWPCVRVTLDGQVVSANAAAVEALGEGIAEGTGKPAGRLRLGVLKAREVLAAGGSIAGAALDLPGGPLTPWMRGTHDCVEIVLVPGDTSGGGVSGGAAGAAGGTGQRLDGDLAALLGQAPFGIAILDADWRIKECTAAFAVMLHAERVEGTESHAARLVGQSLSELLPPAERERAMSELRMMVRSAAKGPTPVEGTAATAEDLSGALLDDGIQVGMDDEGEAYVALRAKPLAGSSDRVLYLTDISKRHLLETQILQSQKMQAVGQLAGGVAHDFNNLLTAMTGFCDLLLQRHRPGDQSFGDVMQIKQNANRAANLVRQLLAFSRQQTLIPRVIDLSDTLADLSQLLRRLIGETVSLELIHGRDLKPVKVDAGQLEQVLINLVVNARDAMASGGTISMRTANIVTVKPMRRGDEVMPAGSYVVVEVIDTGVGIAPENLTRILEPFFTTKEVGRGTGLGLSTAYGIVKQFGGYMFIDSTINVGTTFAIYLPAWLGAAEEENEVIGLGPSTDLTGTGTVLLVEDEDPVRLFAARALRGKGYTVLEARSGEAALDMLEVSDQQNIDLLITDVVMPGIDGPTLVKRVRGSRPNLPVICISGYSEDALRQRIADTTGITFLPKPFSLKQLAGAVKSGISSGTGSRPNPK